MSLEIPNLEVATFDSSENASGSQKSQKNNIHKTSKNFRIVAVVLIVLLGISVPIYFALNNKSKAGSSQVSFLDPVKNLTVISENNNETVLEWSPSISPLVNKYIVQKTVNGTTRDIGTTTKGSYIDKGKPIPGAKYDVVPESDYNELGINNVLIGQIGNVITNSPLDNNGQYKYTNSQFKDYFYHTIKKSYYVDSTGKKVICGSDNCAGSNLRFNINTMTVSEPDPQKEVALSQTDSGYNIYDSTGSINSVNASFTVPSADPSTCSRGGNNSIAEGIFIGLKSYIGKSQAASDGAGLQIMCLKNSKKQYTIKYSLYLENIPVEWNPINIVYGGQGKATLAPGDKVTINEKVSGSSLIYNFTVTNPKENITTNFSETLPSCSDYGCYYNSTTVEMISDQNNLNIDFGKVEFSNLFYAETANPNQQIQMLSRVAEGEKPAGSVDNIFYKWDESMNSGCSTKNFSAPILKNTKVTDSSIYNLYSNGKNTTLQDLINSNLGEKGNTTGHFQDVAAISGLDTNIQNGALEYQGKYGGLLDQLKKTIGNDSQFNDIKKQLSIYTQKDSRLWQINLLDQKNIANPSEMQIIYNTPNAHYYADNSSSNNYCYVEPPSLWDQVQPYVGIVIGAATLLVAPNPLNISMLLLSIGNMELVKYTQGLNTVINFNYNSSFVSGVAFVDTVSVAATRIDSGMKLQDYYAKLQDLYNKAKEVRSIVVAGDLAGGIGDLIDLEHGVAVANILSGLADVVLSL